MHGILPLNGERISNYPAPHSWNSVPNRKSQEQANASQGMSLLVLLCWHIYLVWTPVITSPKPIRLITLLLGLPCFRYKHLTCFYCYSISMQKCRLYRPKYSCCCEARALLDLELLCQMETNHCLYRQRSRKRSVLKRTSWGWKQPIMVAK